MSPRWPSSTLLVWLVGLSLVILLPPAAAESPVDVETYDFSISRGLIEFGKGRYEKAQGLFEKALKAKPGDFDASDYLGQTLLRLKKYEAAEKMFQGLVEANPASGRALLGLGIAQSNLGKYDDALTSLNAAGKALLDNPLVYYYQGLV
ncbi:MAG: tetratricopeptide repeat protein, partial [Nitrospiraceae bacterium]